MLMQGTGNYYTFVCSASVPAVVVTLNDNSGLTFAPPARSITFVTSCSQLFESSTNQNPTAGSYDQADVSNKSEVVA